MARGQKCADFSDDLYKLRGKNTNLAVCDELITQNKLICPVKGAVP